MIVDQKRYAEQQKESYRICVDNFGPRRPENAAEFDALYAYQQRQDASSSLIPDPSA